MLRLPRPPDVTLPPSMLFARLAAALGERYQLEQEIGRGGMAIVYTARDVRHNRRVAVKVLRPELAVSVGDERFLREIELAAGLQHPHILPVYDSGAGDGLLYYVMPFVEGESLSDRIARAGALPVAEAVRLAREIAGALAYAHGRGIVHRDIKPDNLLLNAGHALVMDFGIAHAATGQAVRLTATGMSIGSPLYMSPEQALGSGDIDARTDIYSLGCVLFEMLTGQPPFTGRSLQAILAQSITAPRPRVRQLRPDAPAALEDAVATALAKEPGDRFVTAQAMDAALAEIGRDGGAAPWRHRALLVVAGVLLAIAGAGWAWHAWRATGDIDATGGTGAGVSADARVIAVLPFSTIGAGGPNGTALGEGLVDMLSTNLDGVGGIRTVDPHAVLRGWRERTSATGSIDRAGTIAIGRALGAGSVLTGNMVTAGPNVRLSAELTSVSGVVLARAQADGPADGVFALVDTLSVRLLRNVWRASSPVPALRVSALTTGSLPAMRAYLDGEAKLRRSDWAAASRAYAEAIEQDSSFALAYLRLLAANDWLGVADTDREKVLAQLGKRLGKLSARERGIAVGTMLYESGSLAAADTALALTVRYPDDRDGWMLLGEMRFHYRAMLAFSDTATRAPFERVLALDPTISVVHEHLLDLAAFAGDSATFAADLARLRGVVNADSAAARYARFGTALWGAPREATAAMRSLATRDVYFHELLLRSSVQVPGAAARFTDALARALPRPGDTVSASLVTLLMASARFDSASVVASAVSARTPEMQTSLQDMLLLLAMGFDAQRPAIPTLQDGTRYFGTRPFGRYLTAAVAVLQRDSALARRVLADARGADTVALPPRVRPLFDMLSGWARVTLGDSAAGAREIGAAGARVRYSLAAYGVAPRFVRAVVLSRTPATRAEGIRLLRDGFDADPATYAVRLLALHEAQLAAGDPEAAHTAALVRRAWSAAEPRARLQAQRLFPRGFPR